jgi:serine/threonine protein phosphatase PrpC
MKKFIISYPYLSEYEIDEEKDYFVVLACDGVWDVLTDNEVCEILKEDYIEFQSTYSKTLPKKNKSGKAKLMSSKLIKIALSRGSKDNISCMVVLL